MLGPSKYHQFENCDRNDFFKDKKTPAVARCLVIYNREDPNDYFWERKRNINELKKEREVK